MWNDNSFHSYLSEKNKGGQDCLFLTVTKDALIKAVNEKEDCLFIKRRG